MARRITFEIVTRAQTRGLSQLARALADITKNAKRMNKDLQLDALGRELNSVNAEARKTSQVMRRLGRSIKDDLGDQSERSARNVESLQTRMRDLTRATSTLDRARRRMKTMNDDVAASERRLAEAQQEVAEATSRLRRVQRDPNRTQQQIDDATAAYQRASKSVQKLQSDHQKLRGEFKRVAQDGLDAERTITDIEDAVIKLQKTASGRSYLSKLMPPSAARDLRVARNALNDFQGVMEKTLATDRRAFGRVGQGLGALRGQITQLAPTIPILKNMRAEITAMSRLDTQDLRRAIGNPDAAIRQTTRAIQDQNEATIKIRGEMQRLGAATTRWTAAESQANSVLSSGNAALLERRRTQQMLTRAISQASSVETTAAKRQEQLLTQQRRLRQEQLDLIHRINRAQSQLVRQDVGTAAYREAAGNLERLRTAYTNVDRALTENNANLRQNDALMRQSGSYVEQMTQSMHRWQNAMQSMTASARQNPFQSMMRSMQQLNQFAIRLASTLTSRVRGAITAIANASRSFVASSGNMFAGLQRALQSTGNHFERFADRVVRSMDRSRSSMMEMYAASFSLLMIGREMQQFGRQGFRMMGQSLDQFMEYERQRNIAATAGAQPLGPDPQNVTGYAINSQIIDELILDIQRGVMTPEWLGGGGNRRIPVAFDARELAEGLYYYSSAIGVEIQEANRDQVGEVVSTMMQMARITNTGIEQATKGVLNIALEYGIDPRRIGSDSERERIESARQISEITAQVGYLANISTMEVSDIVETFKMVGPMANLLSGGQPGAGLNETFLMTFLASEVGLRGSKTGRGINRAFSSLLDPTDKMIDVMGKYFPDITDEESYRARFFEPGTDVLRGGIMGFMTTLAETDPDTQARMLAELFTENATRTLVGTMKAFTDQGGLNEWLEGIGGENPLKWMEAAVAESANSINGWFQFMANGWFQLQAAIIGSVEGPLMATFQLIGEFLFELAQSIREYPMIGQIISTIVTALLSLAAVGGTLLMTLGGILLIGRAFALLTNSMMPFIRLASMAVATLLTLAPLFLLIGTAVGLAVMAFQENVFGIQDALNGVIGYFADFEGNIVPLVENIFHAFTVIGDAIRIFFNNILLGRTMSAGSENSLFAMIQNIFGDLLGGQIINSLLRFRDALEPTRQAIREFLSESTFDATQLREVGDVLRGFFEYVFLQRMSFASIAGMINLGEALGIEDLPMKVAAAATSFRDFLNQVIYYVGQIITVWTSMAREIYGNLGRIFSDQGITGLFSAIGTIAQGVAQGVILAFTAILTVVEVVTDRIADFAEGMRRAQTEGRNFMGVAVSFNGVLRAIGITIGAVLGARLALAFSPVAAILVRIMPLMFGLSSILVGVGARFLMVAANIAISTSAFLAHVAAMTVYYTIAGIAALANAGFSLSQAVAASNSAILTAALAAVSAAMGFFAGTTALASAPLLILVGIIILVVAAIFALITALALIAGAFTALAGAGILLVTITQGIGAGFQGLLSFLDGVWSGLQYGITIIRTFIQVLMLLGNIIGDVTGVGNEFRTFGVIVGASLTIIIGLVTALGLALLTLLSPFLLVGAAAVAFGLMLYESFSATQTFADTTIDIFLKMAEIIANIFDVLINDVVIGGINKLVEEASSLGSEFEKALNSVFGRDPISPLSDAISEGVDMEIDLLDNLPDDIRQMREDLRTIGNEGGEAYTGGFLESLQRTPLGQEINEWLEPLGMSLENLDPSNLQDVFDEMIKLPDQLDELAGIDYSVLGPHGEDFQEAMSNWNQWQDTVRALGGDEMLAADFYEDMGWTVPTSQPEIEDIFGPMADEIQADKDAAEQDLENTKAEWEQAVAGLADMSVPDIFSALYDPLAGGQQGSSIISFLAGEADNIIAKAQEGGGGQWLDMNELMADIAGSGVALDESLVGRNMHSALRPAFEILSRQTGVAMEELMADIPIFQAPEQYQAMATKDMTQGIAAFTEEFGSNMFETVDTAMQGLINQETGEAFFEYGLEWSELNNFAIGQAILGHDWNLADFVSEVMGVSVGQANEVLLDAGLSQEAIDAFGNNMYEGVEDAMLSNAGQYNALTTQQYEWLYDATQGLKSDVIHMTESEFGEMSDTMKLILTNMGYTFVVEDLIPPEAFAAARDSISSFADVIEGAGDTIVAAVEGANLQMEGTVSSWSEMSREIDDVTGELMVTLQDIDGTQITIPAAQYDEFLGSLDTVTQSSREYLEEIGRIYREFGGDWSQPGMRGAVTEAEREASMRSAMGPSSGAFAGVPPALQVPVGAGTSEAQRVVAEMEAEFQAADFTDEIQSAIELQGEITIDVIAQVAGLELDALYTMETQIKIPVVAEVVGLELAALYAMQTQIKIPVVAEVVGLELGALYTMTTQIKIPVIAEVVGLELGALYNMQTDITIPVVAKVTNIDTSILTAISSGAPGGGSVAGGSVYVLPVTAKITNVNTDLMSTLYGENGFEMNVTATVSEFDDSLITEQSIDVIANVTGFDFPGEPGASAATVPVTASVTDIAASGNAPLEISGVKALISEFARSNDMPLEVHGVTAVVEAFDFPGEPGASAATVPVKAIVPEGIDFGDETPSVEVTITQVGGAEVGGLLSGLIGLAQQLAVTWTATIAQTGESSVVASLGNVINTATAMAVTWTATIAQQGAAGVGSAISGLIALLNVYTGVYFATVGLLGGGSVSSTLSTIINQLNRIDGRTATATITTRNVTENITVGGIGSFAATGGWRSGGQAVLVGEEGPEVVWFPTDGYVFTAPETDDMLSKSLSTSSNPFATRESRGDASQTVNVGSVSSGDTYNFYGDIRIENPEAAEAWFEEMDRRTGKRNEMARRGMRAVDEERFW